MTDEALIGVSAGRAGLAITPWRLLRRFAGRLRAGFRSVASGEARAGITRIEAQQTLESVDKTLSPVIDVCVEHGDRYRALREEMLAAGSSFGTSELSQLTPMLHESLRALRGVVFGVGVIVAPGTLADAPLWLEWWYLGADGGPCFLDVNLDPGHPGFYEYTRAEWFRVPESIRRPWITGPYLDRGCMNLDLCTVAAPMYLGEEFLGVSAADIGLDRLEATLTPILTRLDVDAAVVNSDGRIVVSNTPRLLTGDLLAVEDRRWVAASGGTWACRADGVTLTRLPGIQWALVTFPPGRLPQVT